MKYRKVFSKARFQTKGRNSFSINYGTKSIVVGARSVTSRSAYLGKVIEQGKISTVLDYGVFCDLSFPHVIGVFGSRGSGKSFDLGVFLEEVHDYEPTEQEADGRDSIIVFDVQDQFWTLRYSPCVRDPADQRQLAELKQWGLEGPDVFLI